MELAADDAQQFAGLVSQTEENAWVLSRSNLIIELISCHRIWCWAAP
jgi:hypothetical protein